MTRTYIQSVGLYVVLLYILFRYLLPMLFQYFYFEEIYSIYPREKFNSLSLFIVFLVSFFVIVGYMIQKKAYNKYITTPWSAYNFMGFKYYLKLRSYIVLIYLLIAIYSAINQLGNLRYTGVSLTDSGAITYFILINKTLVKFDIILIMILKNVNGYSHYFTKKSDLAILLSHFLMLGGNADALIGVVVATKIFAPNIFSYFFSYSNGRIFKHVVLKYTTILLFMPVAILTILVLGESIKRGYSILELDIGGFISSYLSIKQFYYYLIESYSSHLHSLNYTISLDLKQSQYNSSLGVVFDSLWYRIGSLLSSLGFYLDIEKPLYSGFSQMNYLFLTGNYNDLRQGTSPGVIASFNYVFGPWFGAFFSILYFIIIARLIDRITLASTGTKYSVIGMGVILSMLSIFFQSPLDLLNIFDNASIFALLITTTSWALAYGHLRKKKEIFK